MSSFKSPIQEEIERKRKLLEEAKAAAVAKSSGNGNGNDITKRYIKRGEVEKIQEEKYRKEQEKRQRQRELKLLSKLEGKQKNMRNQKENGTENVRSSSETGSNSEEEEDSGSWERFNLTEEDIIRRLRARDQPIRLFGETDKQRIKRLQELGAMEEDTEGQRDDFRKALENAAKGLALRDLKRVQEDGEDNETQEFMSKKKKKESDNVDTTAISLDYLRRDPDKTMSLLAIYFKRLLREWEKDLEARPEAERRSTQGKLATAIQKQSTEYLKPFFKLLKRRAVPQDVLERITEIAELMQKREYLQANDHYLRLSIGNAPWPIGVTMVGVYP